MNHLCTLGCVADRLLRNISTSLAQTQGLAGIQHTAVSIATTVDQIVLSLLCSGTEHGGTLEPVSYHGLRYLGTEVAKVYTESVTSGLLYIGKSLLSVNLALNDADGALVDTILAKFFFILGNHSLTTVNSQ